MAKKTKSKAPVMPAMNWAALRMADKEFEKVRNSLLEGESRLVDFNVHVCGQLSVGYVTEALKPIDYRSAFAHMLRMLSPKQRAQLAADLEAGIFIDQVDFSEAARICECSAVWIFIRRPSVTGRVVFELL